MKSFDAYMAESGRQSTLDDLRRTFKYDSAKSEYERSGGYGQSESSSQPQQSQPQQSFQAPNFEDTIRRAQEMQREAYKPLISQLQSNIPEISKNYASQKQTLEGRRAPLKQRYDNLISELKGRQEQDVNRQTLATNTELGKRGILGSSGAAQQEIINTTNPINQAYSSQMKDVGLASEEAQRGLDEQISGLSSQELNDIRNLQNSIAQYQAQSNTEGINLGSRQAELAQQLAQSQQQAAEQRRQFDAQNALALRQFNEVQLPQSQLQLKDLQSQIAQRSAAAKAVANPMKFLGGGSGGIGQLQQLMGGKINMNNIGRNVIDLINAGNIKGAIQLYNNP